MPSLRGQSMPTSTMWHAVYSNCSHRMQSMIDILTKDGSSMQFVAYYLLPVMIVVSPRTSPHLSLHITDKLTDTLSRSEAPVSQQP